MYILKNSRFQLCLLSLTIMIGSCTKTDTTEEITGNWIRRSDFEGVTRSEGISFTINDKAYVGTGYDGTDRLKDLWQYDPVQNFWVQMANLPGVARNSAVGFSVNDKGYVGTGYDGLNRLQDFWQYNPTNNSWAQKANFAGSARYDAVGFGILSKGYISTGYDGNYLKDIWEFDVTNNVWEQKVSLGGSKRSGALAFVYQNKAYLCTGANNGSSSSINDLWVFDPLAATSWTEKRKISDVSDDDYDDDYNIIRSNAVSFVMNDKAYITTGENGAVLGTTWEYDFSTDIWTNKTSFEGVARIGAIGFSVNNRGYVLTGRSSNTPFDDIREFFPSQDYEEND
ncbi:MAG: galactose oxidase [Ferruginibacter sp.]|nr:galactose oxidase [Ferruginibacter sp.]